jgi:hypothetical protein
MKAIGWLMVAAGILGAGAAWASPPWTAPVYVEVAADGSGRASGDVASARVQPGYAHIGCYADAYPGGTIGVCTATDGTNWTYCYSFDPSVVNLINNSPEMSGYVSFQSDPNRICQHVLVDGSSPYGPKSP